MHTVREFIEVSFKELGIELAWEGNGAEEKGRDSRSGKILVEVDPEYFRPTEVEQLKGDFSKAKKILGWEPKTTFHDLVKIMVKADWEKIKKHKSK